MAKSEWSSSEWSLPTQPPAPPPSTVFATLVPANDAAQEAFHGIAEEISGKGDGCGGAGRFMVVDGERAREGKGCDGVGKVVENGSANEDGSIGRGWHVLDFGVEPRRVERGWVVGSGQGEGSEDDPPDIVLTREKHSSGINRQYASFNHNYTSGAFIITALSAAITLDGTETLQTTHQRLIHNQKTSLEFGPLKYILSLSPFTAQDHRTLLTNFTAKHSLSPKSYPSNLIIPPSPYDRLLPPSFILKNTIGHGITGIVSAGLHLSTGNCVAIKTIRRYTDSDAARIDKERKLSQIIGSHPNICQLICIIAPEAEDPERGFKACGGVDEAFIIYEPLASWTVERLVDMDTYVAEDVCVGLLREWVDGLTFLHGKGIMHRDIKPGNLTILSMKPPRAQLIDFGHAIEALMASNDDVGTKGWRAPELAVLSIGGSKAKRGWYDERIDVFSLGISWYTIFCRVRGFWWSGREVKEKDLDRMKREMGKRDVGDGERVVYLVARCIDWEADMRPKAVQVRERLRTFCEGDEGRGEGGAGWDGGREDVAGWEASNFVRGKQDENGKRSAWR